MNGHTRIHRAPLERPFAQHEVAAIYRAMAIAEAEREAHLERAMLDGMEVEGDDGDWEIYLKTEVLQLQ
jgi:hypothetical protein